MSQPWPSAPLFTPRQSAAVDASASPLVDEATAKDWLARWEKGILGDARSRYCDKEMGEELGWLVSPFTNGFYHGYSGDPRPGNGSVCSSIGPTPGFSAA